MPINEFVNLRRSNLTKEQRREAEAAIYGLSTNEMINQISPEEIERMRAIIAQHDQTNKGGIKEFDLNDPPKQPYVTRNFRSWSTTTRSERTLACIAGNRSRRRWMRVIGSNPSRPKIRRKSD